MPGFRLGEVVQLKEGGPLMTVAQTRARVATCQWFGEGGKRESHAFPFEVLKKYEVSEEILSF